MATAPEILQSLSTIANMQGLTLNDVEHAQAKIAAENESVLKTCREMYPQLNIKDTDAFNLKRLVRENEFCESCKGYPCKKSGGTQGFEYCVTEFDGGLAFEYRRCKYAKVANNTRAAKIPPMYEGKTFADYQIDAGNAGAVKGAKTLCSLYVFGAPGTGKTFLASIMGNEFLKQGKSVFFIDTPTLLDKMKSTFDRDAELTLENLMDKLAKVDVLILDDLGTETPTQWAVERLYLVINARYNAKKPLIVTSNYDLQQAADRLNKPTNGERGVTGSRIVSRIRGLCKTARINGEDRRRA